MTIPAMTKDKKAPWKPATDMSPEAKAKRAAEFDAYLAKDRELVKLSLASAARNGDPIVSSR